MAKRYRPEDLDVIEKQFRKLIDDPEWQYLVVDPSTVLRRTIINALVKAGSENILEAKDGIDGILKLKQARGAIVAIVEIKMQNMDGISFMRQMRNDKQFAAAPVIMMSSDGRKELIVQSIRAGANAYLKKPFEPQVLIDKLTSMDLL